MFRNFYYPYYRSYVYPGVWGYSNFIGSAVSNQNLINTGSAIGVNQISTPTVIW